MVLRLNAKVTIKFRQIFCKLMKFTATFDMLQAEAVGTLIGPNLSL